jgi:hypothetical protein
VTSRGALASGFPGNVDEAAWQHIAASWSLSSSVPRLFAVPAQGASWQQLHERVAELSRQRQYPQMLTAALEALRIAEAAFGINHPATAVSTYDVASAYDALEQTSRQKPFTGGL